MDIAAITEHVEGLGGVLTLAPREGDATPELAWGDLFFYYAPDGVLPTGQPFATIVTKNYPGDTGSRLDRPGAFRVNVAAGRAAFRSHVGREPGDEAGAGSDPALEDTVIPHPVYGPLGWLAVVNPGPASADMVRELLHTAHGLARARRERRGGHTPGTP